MSPAVTICAWLFVFLVARSLITPAFHLPRRVVLVGDPQQLPATILSELGREMEMERSLFERLQRCGAPVSMLSVQYRMHPAIRQVLFGGRGWHGTICERKPTAVWT